MSPVMKKYLILGLGGGLVALALAYFTSPLVAGLGVLAYSLMMARVETRAYQKIDYLARLIQGSGLAKGDLVSLTGLSQNQVQLLKEGQALVSFEDEDLDRAIRALEEKQL